MGVSRLDCAQAVADEYNRSITFDRSARWDSHEDGGALLVLGQRQGAVSGRGALMEGRGGSLRDLRGARCWRRDDPEGGWVAGDRSADFRLTPWAWRTTNGHAAIFDRSLANKPQVHYCPARSIDILRTL